MSGDNHIFEIRLVVGIPNYTDNIETSALDFVLPLIVDDPEILIIDSSEQKMKIVPEGEKS